MSISVNGQSVVPPGFRFHPTEEELLTYYLAKKVASQRIDLDVIPDVDLNKLEPWDIQERCRIGTGPQNDWYLFSHKDKKYPTGTRTNRATAAGFWKATGRDKAIYSAAGSGRIGMRKTLVFYKGRAPHGHKSDWIMHEYRLDDAVPAPANPAAPGDAGSTYYSGASSSPVRTLPSTDHTVPHCSTLNRMHGGRPAGRATGMGMDRRWRTACAINVRTYVGAYAYAHVADIRL
ncbi:hypothetical protein ACQJBY_062223 [Aegilops geniculata]